MNAELFVMARIAEAFEVGMLEIPNCDLYSVTPSADGRTIEVKCSEDLIDSRGFCTGMARHTFTLEAASLTTEITKWPED